MTADSVFLGIAIRLQIVDCRFQIAEVKTELVWGHASAAPAGVGASRGWPTFALLAKVGRRSSTITARLGQKC